MAAEEPQPGGVSTPIPARAEFPVNPETLMRSSRSPILRREAQDNHGPPSKPSPGLQSDFWDVSVCAEENMPSFPKEASMEGETEQENLETEASDAPECPESGSPSPVDIQSRSLVLPELWVERGHSDTTPGELEQQLTPELMSLTLASHQAEEEVAASPDSSLQARLGPSQEGQPVATCQLGDCDRASVTPVFKLQWTGSQQSQEQEEVYGLRRPGQEEMDLQREGTLGEDVCTEGILGEQREEAGCDPRTEQTQDGKQEQDGDGVVFVKLGERLNGEVDGGDDGEWAQGDLEQGHPRERIGMGADESKVEDASQQEKQNLEGSSEKPSGKQDKGLEGKEKQIAQKGEASGSMEVPETGAHLQRVDRKEEEEEHDGPSTLPPGLPEGSSSCEVDCPRTEIPDIRTAPPMPEGQSPVMPLPPAQARGGWTPPAMFLASSCSAGESPSQETTPGGQAEGSKLGQGALCGQEAELASTQSPPLPPKMAESTPSGPQEAPLCVTTSSSARSPPVPIPLREPSPAAHFPETSRASLSTISSSPYLTSDTPPSAIHGFLAAEAFMDPWTLRQSPQNTDMGTVSHLRSNSFPGSHRTGSAPDLVDTALSFSHSEISQKSLKPTSHDSSVLRKDRKIRGHGCVMSESHSLPTDLEQDPQEFTSHPERPRSPHSSSPLNPAFTPHPLVYDSSPVLVTVNSKNCPPHDPHSWEKRCSFPSAAETDGQFSAMVPALKRCHHPPPLTLSSRTHVSPRGPLPQAPDPLVARQLRPLPSTPDAPHHTQTSFSSKLRYSKPLPPTPDAPHHSSSSPSSSTRMYKPLPPVPSEAPPLPPKTRGRSRSTLGGLLHPGGQPSPKPISQEWTVASSAGRTSWPPASSRTTDTLVPPGRTKSEVASSLAFSNMTNLAMPSSPTTPWTQGELGSLEEPETPALGRSLRKAAPQEVANGLRRSEVGRARPEDRPSHPQLEKSSSWPHRRDPGRAREASTSGQSTVPGEGGNKQKSWNRQGLRRPSILPESRTDVKSPAVEKSPNPSDNIVYREKKPKEAKTGFSRRCSKLINSSPLLYQEYSDVVLNKEIQSQQRLDSIAEEPGLASPRQPRRGLVSSESYLQRLSMASSSSLWQEIPMVRNSTMLLSMTHSDQKLQEAKFELIVSEASYLRSLHIAVDHFQLSSQLRATLSNQEHQWLFSRLQEVREVSNTFLSDLEENFENNIFTFQVCDVVLNHAPNFRRVYLPYVTNQTYQERTFQNLLSNNSNFREVLEKLESDPICQRLSLKSFLILPFQRITRLKLLLQNILKRTQPGSSEEAEATKAHHALEELIRACNSSVQKMHRTEELIHLSQKIEFECKIFPLISQSRWLVKSGELTALEFSVSPGFRRKLNTRPIHLHLFNDCLLLSRPREGSRFLVFDHAPFSAIRGEKCEMKLHGDHKNLFRLFLLHNTQGTQSEFLLSTETQSEKLRWLSALATPREELDLLECYDSPQVQCLRAYKPRENDELALEKADVVMVTQQSSDGWLEGMRLSDGERGWFPVQQVEFISNKDVCARNLKEAHRVKTAKLQLVEQQT